MPSVLIADKLSPKAVEIFEKNGIKVDSKIGLSEEELCQCIKEYDGLAIRSATKVTPRVLQAAKKLKVVGRAGIGVDNVDIPEATNRGVVVMNTPFGNSVTTAEHTISLMMALARQIPQANASTQAGKWEKSKFMGIELAGKTLGLIGCGNIGSIVADRAQGLKMKVVVFDPFLSDARAKDINVKKVELEQLFAEADIISLHTPLNEGTRHIINMAAIKKMKKGVRIINCARGGLVVESDVKKAIEEKLVAGIALDVFEEEPAKENVLFGTEEVICTPHLGASTAEAQENVALQIAEQISAYLVNGTVENAVNTPSVSAEDAVKLNPYLALGRQLGGFCGQIIVGGIKAITIEYEGSVTSLNTKPVTAVALQSLLSHVVENVNMVNASLVAKERNIKISEVKRERSSDYQTLIRISVDTDKGKKVIAGTLFGGDKPRIVEVGEVKLEAGLGPVMLYINNEDKPGLIGNLGKLLGDTGINIANFHLGRDENRTDAIALLEVDQVPNEDVVAKVNKLPSVIYARLLHF